MAEFKIGDKVVREKHYRYGQWEIECARNDVAVDAVFEVSHVMPDDIRVKGLPWEWDAACFRLATGLEEHLGTGLSAEDRLCDSDAHIECLRNQLEAERRLVAELQAEVARCCGHSAAMEEKIAKLLSLNHELSDQVSDLKTQLASYEMDEQRSLDELNLVLGAVSTERDVLKRAIAHRVDERDAAVAAAKSLGEDLRAARKEMRWARFTKRHLSGLYDALFAATADIDLHHVATQLYLLAQMCEEQGNGADATLAYNAAQVVELTAMTLASLDEVQEYIPHHFPPMEGPLA